MGMRCQQFLHDLGASKQYGSCGLYYELVIQLCSVFCRSFQMDVDCIYVELRTVCHLSLRDSVSAGQPAALPSNGDK